jgi:hypothetical protein
VKRFYLAPTSFSAGVTIASQTLPSRAAPDDVFIRQIETSFYQTANTHVP